MPLDDPRLRSASAPATGRGDAHDSAHNHERLEHATLGDLEAIRLLLRGGSVIDWHRLAFGDPPQVDRFLRVNEFDPACAEDMERLEELRAEAVEYLTRNFGYRIPDEVAHGMPARELFLLASSKGKRQTYACVVLKVMHVMHHLAGKELLFKLPISDDQVFGFVETKVVKVVDELRAAGYPIVEFAWSRKERDSVVTKLLAKKASIAAHVYDKLRFRLVTRSMSDLPAILHELLHRLVPFNYVVPGESVNGILPFRTLLDETPSFVRFADQLQLELDTEEIERSLSNEFSGPSYRVINFVADLPVRIDSHLCSVPDDTSGEGEQELGRVIFVLTEFQVVDAETARQNEIGENSHAAYKERQHERVKARLTGGERALREPAAPPPPLALSDDDDD
jgi:uncharacterized protein (TIGR04552 family)